jgi:hypothetical protein
MTTEQPPPFGSPEWNRQVQEGFERAGQELGKALSQMQRTLAAQGAMGWAYRGELDAARAALKAMSPDQLREMSAAAALLASLADEELSTR